MSSPARLPDVPLAEMSDLTGALERTIREARADVLPSIAGELGRLSALVSLRIVGAGQPAEAPDRWLDTRDAAVKLGMSASWLYEHGAEFAFRRKVGGRYRFSETGLEQWKRRGK